METSRRLLGELVRAAREDAGLSQDALATALVPATNRSAVAHLEQGLRVPSHDVLQRMCEHLHLPKAAWKPLLDPEVSQRLDFEEALSELVGRPVTLRAHDEHSVAVAQAAVLALYGTTNTKEQIFDCFSAVLAHYGAQRPRPVFLAHYLGAESFRNAASFRSAVERYQVDAIRLFASFAEAYSVLSQSEDLDEVLRPLRSRSIEHYSHRTAWTSIEAIPQERLPDLGYISAARAKKEQSERTYLVGYLEGLAGKIEQEGKSIVAKEPEKTRRKIDSLLRQFDSSLQHNLMSPLFTADPDEIRREARRLAPKEAGDLNRMEQTQSMGQRNLARYLAADHLDVYVATSMRTDADFVSVNAFVQGLFQHIDVRPLKLRYFNPTQSWIDDRVAKGLVEALMLKRADFTIYMAQKSDTFGKDSEASVALGQGKPVIVYVPRLYVPDAQIDSEGLGLKDRADLRSLVESEAEGEQADVDETTDQQALLSQLIDVRLSRASDDAIIGAVRSHWADFDLYGEAGRIDDAAERAAYRSWLDAVLAGDDQVPTVAVRGHLKSILVGTTTNFERRATVFREVHPLALQVILSTGVLNGILVARSLDSCASLLAKLAANALDLEMHVEADNYRLIERTTRSTIRVISRHQLVTNAFASFYRRSAQ